MTIIKKFEPIIEEKNTRFSKVLVIILVSLFALTLGEIWASNSVITYGEKYEKLSSLEKNLRMENQLIENEIAKNSSLNVISTKSAELGFSNSQSIQYIR